MNNNPHPQETLTILLGSGCLIGSMISGSAAVVYVDGSTPYVSVNDGAFFSGFTESDPTRPSAFSSNFLNQGNEQATSSAQALSSVPISAFGGNASFQFFFDAQEVNNAGNGSNSNRERNIITQVSLFYLTADQHTDAIDDATQRLGIWSLDGADQIHINDATNPAGYTPTAKPLGNGADVALSIPFSVFPSGASSADYIFLQVTLTDGHNGGDEWVYASAYSAESNLSVVTFANTPSLNSTLSIAASQIVPEPSTAALLLFFSAATLRRRR
ncbi:PEP-CTERM sorting domain-containing protein [Roseibacillus persicicus]|uniref:PEP-CTERM sorting domain-containing protein n=1 Tax=Roseibacillus persicicus TaxID=454148 RepID=UPI00280CE647|nr:PEP-CTERM sorting domain-containing protein [Roseibacillus persicicus]MDQ8189855.1 PEP-CTERM sorting domain-containing protein [Roseibacillus persicicus]